MKYILGALIILSGCASQVTGSPAYMTAYNNCKGTGNLAISNPCSGMPNFGSQLICEAGIASRRNDLDTACIQRAGFQGMQGE